MTTDDRLAKPVDQKRRAYWLKTLHQWHWISSAVCLVAMLGFAITGITLNHAASIAAEPVVKTVKTTLPKALLESIPKTPASDKAPLPENIVNWIDENTQVSVDAIAGEWSEDEVYLSMPRAGGDAWLSLDRATGVIEYEITDRGWVSYFNDLHKGRNTGSAWTWFIDIFAIACVIFAGTGLFLLQLHSRHRPGTWPVVALGLLIPVVLVILFVH